jgi:hypothetical protein
MLFKFVIRTDTTADAVNPVRTVRLAVMNLRSCKHHKNNLDYQLNKLRSHISVLLLSSPTVLFKMRVISIMTAGQFQVSEYLLKSFFQKKPTSSNDHSNNYNNDIPNRL